MRTPFPCASAPAKASTFSTLAEDAAQVVEDHATPYRQEPVEEPARPWHGDVVVQGHRHGGRARAVVRERDLDVPYPIQSEQRLGGRAADQRRRAVVVARNRKIGGLDLSQRGFARKELEARLLGGEARREARRTSRTLAAVGQFLRGKQSGEIIGGRFAQQALDARDLDGVDAAAAVARPRVLRHRGRAAVLLHRRLPWRRARRVMRH